MDMDFVINYKCLLDLDDLFNLPFNNFEYEGFSG